MYLRVAMIKYLHGKIITKTKKIQGNSRLHLRNPILKSKLSLKTKYSYKEPFKPLFGHVASKYGVKPDLVRYLSSAVYLDKPPLFRCKIPSE